LYAVGPIGAGAAAWAPVADSLDAGIELRALRLPGREKRFREQGATSVPVQVADLLADIRTEIRADNLPYAFVGMCSGAVLAFELAAALEPGTLVVVNQSCTDNFGDLIRSLDDITVRDWLANVAGLAPDDITDEAVGMFGATITADIAALKSYTYGGQVLHARIVVMASGTGTDSGWDRLTTGTCEVLPLETPQPALDEHLGAVLSRVFCRVER
jgi:surfactin synthase thioesterase subunit